MYPQSLHIYGPFTLNGYNGAIIVGILVFLYAALRNPARKKIIRSSDFISLSAETGIAAVVGARLLHVLSDWQSYHSWADIFAIWEGGLSILGGLFGALAYSFYYMYKRELPMLPVYSLGAIYAPLIHGIARIGCFLIGCCHGCPTNAAWGITYTDPLSHAPLNIPLHPTQLYSSLFYFALFFLLRYCIAPRTKLYGPTDTSTLPPLTHAVATEVAMAVQAECIACHAEAESEGGRGAHHTIFNEITLITAYLMGMSLERFINDFFRGDRITDAHGPLSVLSFHQWTALSIFTCTLLFFLYSRVRKTHIPHAQ